VEGTVKWFSSANQPWGYIKFVDDAGSNRECFVHFKHISRENQENPRFRMLKPGQRVSFDIGPGFPAGKGTQALNVKVLNDGSGQPGFTGGGSGI
jgi:cold shock CspA family protein